MKIIKRKEFFLQARKSANLIQNPLSAETVSLIHHVELNESGWWKKAIGQVVKSALWQINKPVTLQELQLRLKHDLSIEIMEEVLVAQLGILSSQGAITKLDERFKLSEQARKELTASKEVAVGEAEACCLIFVEACERFCPNLDSHQAYQHFARCLQRTVQVSGANLFHLLVDGQLERDIDWLGPFLSNYPPSDQDGLRQVLSVFFSPVHQECRSHILRLMTAHFFAEASQLSANTLQAIEGQQKKRSIKVVLDTNFLFSILKLHNNPGDDSALSLVELKDQTGKNFEIVLYVLPSTLEEVHRVLTSQVRLVEKIRTSRAMAKAALNQPLPSIAKKFFDAATKTPGLSAEVFFRPYLEDMRSVLMDKGIRILDAHPAIYNVRQDVIDDVLDEMKREETELPEAKRKGYETLLHDSVLWHAVKDRRSANDHSPFDVEYWGVSIDWRLISFDRQKRAAKDTGLPLVLHPSSLIQLIQFWIPRSADLDDVLVNALRLPLYFQSFDAEDEKVTVKILESISRFENVGDFTENTINVLLSNQALRGRLKSTHASNEEVFDLVRDELVTLHNNVVNEFGVVSENLRLAGERLEQEKQNRLATVHSLQIVSGNLEAVNDELEHERVARINTESELGVTRAEAIDVRRRYDILVYSLLIFGVSVIASSVLFLGSYLLLFRFWNGSITLSWLAVWGLSMLPMIIAMVISPKLTDTNPNLSGWPPAALMSKLGRRTKAFFTLAVVAIFSGAAWDACKYAYKLIDGGY